LTAEQETTSLALQSFIIITFSFIQEKGRYLCVELSAVSFLFVFTAISLN
jgi:hypothetical protein